jgi:hypothetical protein
MLNRLVSIAIVTGLLTAASPMYAQQGTCSFEVVLANQCGGSGSSVTVTGTQPSPQHPGSSPYPGANPGSSNSGTSGPQYSRPQQNYDTDDCRGVSDLRCVRGAVPGVAPDAPASAPGAPAISITDLVTLSPATATPSADPGNVGIAGLPTNFVTMASVHTRTGTLFGAPLTARFTPVGYDFTYGDGTTAHTTTPGATWDALHQPQFTPTATSHVYDDRGTYDTTVTIHYTAEIDIGTGYIPLAGTLTTPGPTQTIRIYEAHTALVQHTCTEKPTAPGC